MVKCAPQIIIWRLTWQEDNEFYLIHLDVLNNKKWL